MMPMSGRLQGWRMTLFGVALGIGHVTVLLNASAYAPMEIHVASSLGKVTSYATWTQADYMIGMALALPMAGWLGKRFGEFRPLVFGYIGFASAAVICALSTTIYYLVLGRFLLGLAGGITLPLSQALFMKEFPDTRKTLAITVWSVFTLAPAALGPPLGGWISDEPGWRWMFFGDIPIVLTVAGVLWALTVGRSASGQRLPLDWIGVMLMFTVVVCLQTAMNMATDEDWFDSRYVAGFSLLGIIALACFIVWEIDQRDPIVDLRLFTRRNYVIGVTVLVVGFFVIQGLLTFFVVQLQSTVGYSAFLAGLFYLPMLVFAKPVANLFHHLTKRVDPRLLATVSLLGFAATYFWLSAFDRVASYQLTFWPKLLEGAALGGFFVPLTAIFLFGLPSELQSRAGELANLLRLWAGAMGIPAQTAIWYRRSALHQTHAVEHLTALDPMTDETLGKFIAAGYSEPAAHARLTKLVMQHASILSINEVFWIAGCVFLVLTGLIWLSRPVQLALHPKPQEEARMRALEDSAAD
jgi:DHA2 family multidrug resistance protein